MSFKEIIEAEVGQAMQYMVYDEKKITLHENTPEELTVVVSEMCDYIEGRIPQEQFEFWKAFPRSISPYNGKPLHGEIKMRIGREFLKGYE